MQQVVALVDEEGVVFNFISVLMMPVGMYMGTPPVGYCGAPANESIHWSWSARGDVYGKPPPVGYYGAPQPMNQFTDP